MVVDQLLVVAHIELDSDFDQRGIQFDRILFLGLHCLVQLHDLKVLCRQLALKSIYVPLHALYSKLPILVFQLQASCFVEVEQILERVELRLHIDLVPLQDDDLLQQLRYCVILVFQLKICVLILSFDLISVLLELQGVCLQVKDPGRQE